MPETVNEFFERIDEAESKKERSGLLCMKMSKQYLIFKAKEFPNDARIQKMLKEVKSKNARGYIVGHGVY